MWAGESASKTHLRRIARATTGQKHECAVPESLKDVERMPATDGLGTPY